MTGEVFQDGTPESELFTELWDRVCEAGWIGAGGGETVTGRINDGFVLPKTVRDISVEEVVKGLGLADEEGNIAYGYTVAPDEEADGVYVGYEGLFDNHYAVTLELMAKLPEDDGLDEMRADVMRDPRGRAAYLGANARRTFEKIFADIRRMQVLGGAYAEAAGVTLEEVATIVRKSIRIATPEEMTEAEGLLEQVPQRSVKEVDQRIREAALELLHKDKDLDDDKFTPPGAIGLALPEDREDLE